ncbi:glycosyltransferase [Tsukamurella soli]|uniref:Glycosyltransferase n=1 Tax=Tsukamurella soli TaxID=644556 RepID=A0ABP8J6Y3_9ACTN
MTATDQTRALLQRVILPRPGEPLDVRALYLDEADTNTRRAHAPTRTSLSIAEDSEVSFATYFNAFPASYWRRWTVLKSVVLRVTVRGTVRVDLYRSKVDGSRIGLGGSLVELDAEGIGTAEFTADLGPFEDGGWIWFDLTADSDAELVSAGWYAAVDEATLPTEKRVTVGIPTFNRPDDAVEALRALTSDPEVDAVIDAVLMPDQGTRRVVDHPDFAAAIAPLGDRFHRFEQGNLGGSGGYSRIMYEALRLTDSPYVLYMDDDIAIEPDSILRALAFARFAKTPMLVGGQMLNLQDRSHLHCMGEVIDRGRFMWTAAPFVKYDHDFAKYPLSDRKYSRDLHRRIDVDGNGWWMCLIPRAAAEQIGLPLPLFIKWDDWDYALRAAAAGFPTATVPGIAIWHMAWSDKDDAIDWQAYFHLRNRLVVAALHHNGDHRGIMKSSVKALLKHLLCLEYSTAAIQIEAMRDFLAGPEGLFDLLPTALPKVAAMRKEFPDAVVLPSATELPRATGEATALGTSIPLSPVAKAKTLAAAVRNNLRPADPRHHEVPQANYPPIEARWFSLGRVDGVTVTTADGRGVVFRQRDRDKMLDLMRRSLAVHREVDQRFDEMRERYRAAYRDLTSVEAWSRVFEPTGTEQEETK